MNLKVLEEFPATGTVLISVAELERANREIEWLNVLYYCDLYKWEEYGEAVRFASFLSNIRKYNSDEFKSEKEMYEFAETYVKCTRTNRNY